MKNASTVKAGSAAVFSTAAPIALSLLSLRWLDSQAYTVPLLLCLLCVVLVSINGPRWSGWVCALISALCFNYFFTAPVRSLTMTHLPDIVTILVFLACAALISQQTQRMREQTEKSLQADRLLLAQRAENEREQLRFALMSSLSHDLKTPLVTMMGSASSLKELRQDLSEQDQEDLVDAILSETHRLHKYIGNLLDITRLGTGELALDRQWIGIHTLIHALERRVHKAWPDTRLEVHVPSEPTELYVHPALIEQALFNVVDNAFKFSPQDLPVTLNVRVTAKAIEIDVIDQGPGIPPALRVRALAWFDTLGRGDHHAAGDGLGLAIANGMIGAHGGQLLILDPVKYESGTCIRIVMPRIVAATS
ncbi:DUF4118 domain-containing protein [Salinispirillum marinum]|uniref:histidine kinase n=2 Tax=Saccharospirillaceae TaxID=255527 RepID=A0ABV8BEH7_9GAMM